MTTQRTLAVAAAILFVISVGLATMGSQMVSLGSVIAYVFKSGDVRLHDWLLRVLGAWSWTYVAGPLLVRPAWLPFGSLGLICAGLAMSWPARDATHRSHRRS